mmetsp:Transcript_54427/g.100570  ORF Transcript_54427/g.100570 Transcript_54427/m.100570 type:complete len:437 (-) Transcript_54427:82-1392(-)
MGNNCVTSASIGCLFCFKGCNANNLINLLTFIPPRPSYKVEPCEEDPEKGRIVYQMPELRRSSLYKQAAEAAEVRWVKTRLGNEIPVVWVHNMPPDSERRRQDGNSSNSNHSAEGKRRGVGVLKQDRDPGAPAPIVLLHCHGNATDIGIMMGPYYELAMTLGIEVVGVEYSGYGVSVGKPSTANTFADVEAAYELIVSSGIAPSRVIAYGQSIGSGPVSSLAAKKPIGGAILHSPLLSGIKVIDPQPDRCCRPSTMYQCFDFYPNDRRLQCVTCPVFVIHGQSDEIIPFYHGFRLHEVCPRPQRWPPYFPEQAGHNDVVESDTRAYFGEVSNFIHGVHRRSLGLSAMPTTTSSGKAVTLPVPPAAAQPQTSEVQSDSPKISNSTELPSEGEKLSAADFLSVSEPAAGPEDGRYEMLRKGVCGPAMRGGGGGCGTES